MPVIFYTMNENAIFTQQFDIQSHHIAENFEVTLQYLLGCIQQTADRHVDAYHIGWHDLNAKGCFWAIYRMGLKINKMPCKYDRITVRTWANVPQNLFQPRSFEVLDADGNLMVSAQSIWIILDFDNFKPQKIDDVIGKDILDAMGYEAENPMQLKISKISGNQLFEKATRDVLYSDIDTNQHVNNTVYPRWLVDSVPVNFLHSHRLTEMVINYVQQARLGDKYDVTTVEAADGRLATTIARHGTDEDFCKITTRWTNAEC